MCSLEAASEAARCVRRPERTDAPACSTLRGARCLARHLLSLLTGFRKAYRDCLLPALYRTALSPLSTLQLSLLRAMHSALHILARALGIFSWHFGLRNRSSRFGHGQ